MSFLSPAFLIGAAAIAIPLLLHLLRRDVAPEVPFTAVRLLRTSPVERAHRRRLRDLLLLAARVAALLLLAAAFARPYVQAARTGRIRVVAIDRSYSMGGAARFGRALELARQAVDQAGTGEQVAVIAFDDRADVVAAPGSAASARSALSGLTPGFGATRYRAAIEAAKDVAAGAGGRIVVITDLQRAGWEGEPSAALPASLQLEIEDVGEAGPNLAVTRVAVEPDRVLASIRNSGTSAQTGRVRALLDGREVAASAYRVEPDEETEVPIAWRPPAQGSLAVSVDDPQGFAADNVRYVALDVHGPARALVVTGGGPSGIYLARALETTAGESAAFDVKTVSGSALSSMSPGQVAGHSMVALLSTRGLDRKARETLGTYVRKGGGLLVAAAADVEASVLSTIVSWQPPLSAVEAAPNRGLTLAATDPRHPIFRPFGALTANLGRVRFDRSWQVSPEGWHVLARFSDGSPALMERPDGLGRVMLFASDLDRRWNDFPLHPAFVPFAIETVRYTGRDRQLAGEFMVADAPAGAGPGPGVYRVAPGNRAVAVNVDARESAADRITVDAFDGMVHRSGETVVTRATEQQAQQTEARQSYWRYGLMLMIAALVAESAVGRA
jgi:hypothetical protein